ncbi:hypothetical protein BS50DRAFT_538316 [Corynespora cassiicola Philippines]|uniref:Ribosomal RNA methyltransferase FtsJ domain-containing protein n=1 Tax=Corynespora cassiicola Philippines TaxID=1448308 RepID=A0A2T2N001_CORCC|nr:hypothetical protein BS50DRAFT_538316 [Corynespora cassiicola Philippines]
MEHADSIQITSHYQIFLDFLLRDDCYQKLHSLQVKGWNSPEGDAYFQRRQWKTLAPNDKAKRRMFGMMQSIAKDMDLKTSAFSSSSTKPNALDLCMAPGGFLSYFLKRFPDGTADAITLPEENGGHEVLLSLDHRKRSIKVTYTDVTMFSGVFGVNDIPKDHPEEQMFLPSWPYMENSYDLVICDGQTLRTQKLAEYRQKCEQSRLFNSQLVLALKSVRPGGTIIALLHRTHKWRTFTLLRMFNKFSNIQLFKHERFHAEKSSFYLIAKNVQPQRQEAIDAMESFRQNWICGTFPDTYERNEENDDGSNENVQFKLGDFGAQFCDLVRPIWEVQAAALENASWMKGQVE